MRKLRELEVSKIGMGCMGFSHGYGTAPDHDYSIEAIRAAFSYGCTFFDTAETYGTQQFYPGHNEQLVGEAVEPFRKEIVLATKLHFRGTVPKGDKELKLEVCRHLEKSLHNLRSDYVDLYYLHRVNEDVSLEEVAEVMGKLIREGIICSWGLSQVSAEMLRRADQVTPVSAVQNIYSTVERSCEADIFPYCIEHGIGVVPFSPIASGLLSGKVTRETKSEGDDVRKFVPQLSEENLDANQPILKAVSEYAKEKGATNAQIALVWMLHKYPNVVPIPGSKNKERILENLGASEVKLTEAEFSSLEQVLNACTVYGHRGHVETEQNPTFAISRKKH